MDRLIYTALTGAKAMFQRQETLANNLANANTPGFRAETTAFRAAPAGGNAARRFVLEATTGADFTPGPVQRTGRDLDVAVQGDAWLAVQGRDGQEAYTRSGSLQVASDGTITTAGGLPVIGDGGPLTAPADTTLSVAPDGTISATPNGGSRAAIVTVGRLKLVAPAQKDLVRGEDGLFRTKDGNPAAAAPNATVSPGAVEGSNVNTAQAMVGMIGAARQFEMQMKLLSTAEANARAASQMLSVGN